MPFLERKLVRYGLYVVWAMVAFVISLVIAFPDDRVKQIIIVQAEKQLGYKYEVSITELDLWWRLGVELEGVTVVVRPWSSVSATAAGCGWPTCPRRPQRSHRPPLSACHGYGSAT